jgi:high-affinity Fe2+/Pb2+ permease
VLAVIMLSVAFAYFIHWNGQGLDLQWAFTIVFGVYLLVAGLLAFVGVRKVKKVRAPERAIAQANEAKQILTRERGPAGPVG